jgi:hypothetical protein
LQVRVLPGPPDKLLISLDFYPLEISPAGPRLARGKCKRGLSDHPCAHTARIDEFAFIEARLFCPASEPPLARAGAFFCALSVISYAKPAACRSETASRFARDLIVAETGFRHLRDAGITLIAADAPNSFLDDTPTSAFIRQVLAAVQELDKAMIVSKPQGRPAISQFPPHATLGEMREKTGKVSEAR